MTRRGVILAAGMVLAAVAVGTSAFAAQKFDPVLQVTLGHTDSVGYSTETATPDTYLTVGLDLSWKVLTNRTRFELGYAPRHEAYKDNTGLSNTSHAARLVVSQTTSLRSSWSASLGWTRSERQQLAFDLPGQRFVYTPRVRTTSLLGRIDGRWTVSQRSRLLAGVSGSQTNYASPPVVPTQGAADAPTVTADVTDASDTTAFAAWEIGLTANSAFRSTLSYSHIKDLRGPSDVQRLLVAYVLGQPTRLQAIFTAGAGRTRFDEKSAGGDPPTSFVGGVVVSGRVGKASTLSGGAEQDVSGTSGTSGTARTRSVYGSLAVPASRRSTVLLAANWAQRTPLGDPDPASGDTGGFDSTTTRSARAEYDFAVSPRWFLVASGDLVSQRGPEALADGGTTKTKPFDIDYKVFSLGVRWAPTAPER